MSRGPGNYVLITGASTLFAAGAAGQTLNGAAVQSRLVDEGSLSCLLAVTAKTNTTTFTAKWQVSGDGTTYYDMAPENNAANVVFATGTGSSVTTTKVLEAPQGCYGWPYIRLQVITAVSTTDGTDDAAAISYRHLKDRW